MYLKQNPATLLHQSLLALVKQGNYFIRQMSEPESEQMQGNLLRELTKLSRTVCGMEASVNSVQRFQLTESAQMRIKSFCAQLTICHELEYIATEPYGHLVELAHEVEKQLE